MIPRRHELLATIASLHDAGLNLLPVKAGGKAPDLPEWGQYRTRRYSKDDLLNRLGSVASSPRVAIVCGGTSGGFEAIDFDLKAMQYAAWSDLVEHRSPGLLDRLVIETSPSGGRHVLYRCESAVPGSRKLARVRVRAAGPEPVEVGGKSWTPTQEGDAYFVEPCGIETRGEGGIVVCWPTEGYALVQGDLLSLPTITQDEREVLISSAVALDEHRDEETGRRVLGTRSSPGKLRAGDDFSERGDVAGELRSHGWRLVRDGENQHWARPGGSMEVHATLKDRVFHVFSTNAEPFKAGEHYSPFAVYTLLNHDGDFEMAARTLGDRGYGDGSSSTDEAACGDAIPAGPTITDGRPVPAVELMRRNPTLRPPIIDGLLRQGEVMNIIGAPKSGKSWLVLDLLTSVAAGSPWLGRFATTPGRVLLFDNELHDETVADRLEKVLIAGGSPGSILDRIDVFTARGKGMGLRDLEGIVHAGGEYLLVVVDAFYRALGDTIDENDNSGVTRAYNLIDQIASRTHAAIASVHPASKGEQGDKSITDVGSGAGAQSRAVDTHLVLRDHREEGAMVLDAVVRSWPRLSPICLRRDFPRHRIDPDLDPSELRRPIRKPREKPNHVTPAVTSNRHRAVEIAVETLRRDGKPLPSTVLHATLEEAGISDRKIPRYLDVAVKEGKIVSRMEGRKTVYSLPPGHLVAEAGEDARPAMPFPAHAGEPAGDAA